MPTTLEPEPVPPSIRLRRDRFEAYCNERHLHSLSDRAGFIGIHKATMWRILADKTAPGEAFIAAVLAAFGEGEFYDLFTLIVDDDDEPKSAAA